MSRPSSDRVGRSTRGASARAAGAPRAPSSGPVVPRGGYFGVLADETRRASLELLAEHGPLAHKPYMRRVCELRYISFSTFDRLHTQLVQAGLVVCSPHESDRRTHVDDLTSHAHSLLKIGHEIEAVERWAGLRAAGRPSLLSTIADRRRWLVVRELFDGPFHYTELSARLPWLGQGTLNELLPALTDGGLVRIESGPTPDRHRYVLSEVVGALPRVVALAACFRRQITPRSAPWLTGDVSSFIRLLERAPALRAPPQARGSVLLQVTKAPEDERGWPDIEVGLRHGRIVAHPVGASVARASARALPLAWYQATLDASMSTIAIEGEAELARTLLSAIAAVVAACPRP